MREILEAFASETVSGEVILNALADGGFESPPETADDLADFANGALRAEVTAVLGGEVADAVVDGLTPVLEMMRRSEREAALAAPPLPRMAHRAASRPEMPAVRSSQRSLSRPELAAVPSTPLPVSSPPITTRPSTPPDHRPEGHAPRPSKVPRPKRTNRETTDPGDATRVTRREAPRPATGAGLTDLAIVTADPVLAAELVRRFPTRRVVVGESLDALPRSRVVLVDTRHALDALRVTWSPAKAPHVAVLWPADTKDRARFEAFQPHVPRVVCAGDEAEMADVIMLVSLQLTPHP